MLVKDVMTTEVQAVRADAPLMEAVDLLEQRADGILAVFEEDRLLGTLTEHDLAAWIAVPDHAPGSAQVRDVLAHEAIFSREDQEVREVARLMKEQHAPGLVVLRDDQPVGTITLADLAGKVDGSPASPLPQPPPVESGVGSAPPARILLQPIAAPSILGLFGLAAAMFMIGAYDAGWFGGGTTVLVLAPFAAIVGGLGQLLAGMWAFKARDGLATALHGTWGSFWLAFGVLYALVAGGSLALGAVNPGLGWWFIPLAAITGTLMVAAIGRNLSLSGMLFLLLLACIALAAGLLVPSSGWVKGGGYLFMGAALVGWYTATALVLEESFRRVVLPLGKPSREANIPGRRLTRPVEWRYGEPGVRAGQ